MSSSLCEEYVRQCERKQLTLCGLFCRSRSGSVSGLGRDNEFEGLWTAAHRDGGSTCRQSGGRVPGERLDRIGAAETSAFLPSLQLSYRGEETVDKFFHFIL